MNWYEREIKKYSVDMNTKIYAWIIIALSFSIYFYFTKWVYKWEDIEIIPLVPWIRILISALTYITIWSLLYRSKLLYKPLFFIFVRVLGAKRLYKEIKAIIWILLIWFMYFVLLPITIIILNKIISFFYNIILILFYLSPVVAISGGLILIMIYFKKRN